MQYDLHSHSTASDGTLNPSELVHRAAQQGVDALALTDHDTTDGMHEARKAAQLCGIELICGVEISVSWEKRTIHILGLGIDDENDSLQTGLKGLRDFRDWRAEEIARKLEKAGVADAFKGARKYVTGKLIGRTHFARYLVECGKAKNVADVFKKFLVQGKPGHVSGQWAGLQEVVGWIRDAGGHAVIAHPARYKMSATRLRKLIQEFKDAGGSGIEVVSGSHGPNDRHNMAQYARQFDLYASSGSDYHGPENPWIELGRLDRLPASCKPIWTLWN
jgi:predicted metal-dependent phosphoesterase TrpH